MNLTDKEKLEITKEMLAKDPAGTLGPIALTKLGRLAAENGVSLKYSTYDQVNGNQVLYRLLVTSHTDMDDKEAEQLYFIDCTFYVPKNNLEKLIHEEFRKHEHALIPHAQVYELKDIYQTVVDRYRANKGRATVEFRQSDHGDNKIWIKIADSLHMTLIPVSGDFYTEVNNRKEVNNG